MIGKGLFDDRRKLRVVRHRKRLKLAELPVKRHRVGVIGPHAEVKRHGLEALIEGHEAGEIGHTEGDVNNAADFLGHVGTDLQDVRFIRSENADRTPGFVAV